MLIPMTLTFDFENLLLLYSFENSVLKKVTLLHILRKAGRPTLGILIVGTETGSFQTH